MRESERGAVVEGMVGGDRQAGGRGAGRRVTSGVSSRPGFTSVVSMVCLLLTDASLLTGSVATESVLSTEPS